MKTIVVTLLLSCAACSDIPDVRFVDDDPTEEPANEPGDAGAEDSDADRPGRGRDK